jgi:hypothetical protein
MDDRLVVTLTVGDLRDMMKEAAREATREAMSALPIAKLTKAQLAVALGRSTSTIDRYVADGMPCDDAGTRRMFDLQACRAWLRSRPEMRKNVLSEGVTRKTRAV